MEDINRRFSEDRARFKKKRNVIAEEDPNVIDEDSMKARKSRLAKTLHTHPKYTGPAKREVRPSIRKPLLSEKVSRRFVIAGSVAATTSIIAGSGWGIIEILKRDYPEKPEAKPVAPASPVPFENQTVAHKIDAATTKAEQGALTHEERIDLAKQWFKESKAISKTARDNGNKGYFALMYHTTLGARVAQLKEGGNVFQHITGEGFSLTLPGSPEYTMARSDHLIRGSAMVRFGIMSIDSGIKTDNDLEGHVPNIFIPQVHALGDLAKFDGRVDRIFDPKHKFEEYPYLYRQLAAMQKAGKEYPKEVYVSDQTAIDVAKNTVVLDAAHPTYAVPVYTGPANPDWVADYAKAAYIDRDIKAAYFRGIDFTDPNRSADFRFMNDLNTFFHNGQDMRRSLVGMLGSKAFEYAGQRYAELYTILKRGLGAEFTYHGLQRQFEEVYSPGMVVAVEDGFTDNRSQEVRLFPKPSYEIPNKFEIRLPNRSLVVLTGEPIFMRDPNSLRAVNQWPVRTGKGRFIEHPDGSVIEDASVKEYKGYWQEDWLGKIIQKP